VELESQVESFRERGLGVAALSYDSVELLAEFSHRRHISYPLLSDPDSAIIGAFGLLNPDYPADDKASGVPYPGTFVVDAQGIIREKFFERSYRERQTAASILVRHGGEPSADGADVGTDHFSLRLSASNGTVAPGQRFSLVLDFAMREKHHAYAPDAKDYRPLAVRLDPQPFLEAHPPEFPAPTTFYFAPLDETVPVYEGRFRVAEDVTLLVGPATAKLLKAEDPRVTITGHVDFQVCSDRVCYPPSSVPVSWTLGLRPLDRERSPEPLRH
jgi:hypothetical protein